jgi:hypothetical protein
MTFSRSVFMKRGLFLLLLTTLGSGCTHSVVTVKTRQCPHAHALVDVPMLPGPATKEMVTQECRGEGVIVGDCVGRPEVAHVCISCRKWKTDEMTNWRPLSSRFGTERNPSASAPANQLNGLIVTATMKQIIGSFNAYGMVRVNDTFELNLAKMPIARIEFTRPNYDPEKATRPYVPISSPLIVEKVEVGRKDSVGCLIRLSSTATDGTRARLIIQLWTRELRKGSSVWIKIYQEVFGDISCMAEAEGVLK